MPYYIQRRAKHNLLETIDEIEDVKEAYRLAAEYNLSDNTALHYVSRRPCKHWLDNDSKES